VAENTPSAESQCAGSLILLRRMEQYGIRSDHAKLRKSQAVDAWWVLSGGVTTGPHEFREVVTALSDGISPIQILHQSQSEDEPPPWVTLHYRPQWRDPRVALVWRLGMWILGALFVYVVASILTPSAWRGALAQCSC
jgi:hypothetical protein